MPLLNFLLLQKTSIFEQLQLEEALLRNETGNWVIVNEGSPEAIVLGISSHLDSFVDKHYFERKPVPLIRRFSGGGTVFVDKNTHFVTLIANSEDLKVPCNPQKVLNWTGEIYSQVFKGIDFDIRENDYVIGIKKVGGNAQYMRKDRWLHHTSFLWDYQAENMNYLLMPPKTPLYREKRLHTDFLCTLRDVVPRRLDITKRLREVLNFRYQIKDTSRSEANLFLNLPHRKSTCYIDVPIKNFLK